ncbi:TetR/AcrR family transcriptional regulator [Micromonospora zhanjiangensis]|uniref:TetR/AcrR family transcriptional regulator n=1 Tax=Micromonospora zhanjiangensis TaxID=1522057 RepID=A0ABV8KQN1_9ACTN
MSDLTSPGRSRRRRSEAGRSIAAILDAAVRILGTRPQASVDDVAAAAGVSRQTVYAHFASRDALLAAVIRHLTEETVAAMDAARLDEGAAAEAVVRFFDASWRTLERYPLLLTIEGPTSPEEDREVHRPVLDRLDRLVRRGRDAGEFDREFPTEWLVTAAVAVGHAAGAEVAAGRMSTAEARSVVRRSVLRLLGAEPAR